MRGTRPPFPAALQARRRTALQLADHAFSRYTLNFPGPIGRQPALRLLQPRGIYHRVGLIQAVQKLLYQLKALSRVPLQRLLYKLSRGHAWHPRYPDTDTDITL